MQQSIKRRLERLEAAQQPDEGTWTIGIDIVEWGGADSGFGRVLASIPPRLILPGEKFDYRRELDTLLAAMDQANAEEL